uniref:Uncharacterized protein n=1 Tax=Glossina pallidipes TaxID=7398 RepID=A0A1A9ZG02_GLOPL
MALTFKVNTLLSAASHKESSNQPNIQTANQSVSHALSWPDSHLVTYKNSRLATAHSRKSCRPKREFHSTTKRLSTSYLHLRTTVKQYGLHMNTNAYTFVNTFSEMAKKALKMLMGAKGLRSFAPKIDQYIKKSDSLTGSDSYSREDEKSNK